MNTRALNALAGVIAAAMKEDRTPMGIALAIESAGMLQSPETAAELESLRREVQSNRVDGERLIRAEQRRAELEAVLSTHRADDRAEIDRLRARVAELEAPLAIGADPLAYGPRGYRCGCGMNAHSNLTPCRPDPIEDPHDSPLHHPYTTARLREDQGADDGR
jgi:hypothetical protein